MDETPAILFTAFEPSGDEHAAPVIAELRKLVPDVSIYALGGPKMAEAGARIIVQTTGNASMMLGALTKIKEQFVLRRLMKRWLQTHPVAVHVPTDSPAANWAMCKLVKARWGGAREEGRGTSEHSASLTPHPSPLAPPLGRVVHLVAPQVWAWATWRVKWLQRLSDLVLCVLPFEKTWFEERGVKARFIGHPLFDHPLDTEAITRQAAGYPTGQPRVALLPGSRMGEVATNWPVMLETFRRLSVEFPGATAIVAAATDKIAARVRQMTPDLPANITIMTGVMETVLHWSDVVLAVSGTATLHVARHLKPMVVIFRLDALQWAVVGWWATRSIITTRTYTLPNLLAVGGPERTRERHIVREFTPYTGGAEKCQPVVDALASLVRDDAVRQRQVDALRQVVAKFDGHNAGREAAEAIVEMLEMRNDE